MTVNQTSYKPGQSGNPKGRPPKGYSITDTIRNMMDVNPELKEKLARVIINKALNGDLKALEKVWEYMDGKPTQASYISLDPDNNVKSKLKEMIYGSD